MACTAWLVKARQEFPCRSHLRVELMAGRERPRTRTTTRDVARRTYSRVPSSPTATSSLVVPSAVVRIVVVVGAACGAGHGDGSSHTTGMTTEKIAVSLPKPVAERARRAVRQGRAASVSAYVASAIEEKAKLDELSALLEEMLVESGGPLTSAERRAADRALGIPAGRRRPTRQR